MPAGITEADLDRLTMTDEPSRIMIRSYQSYFQARLDELSRAMHGREAIVDGEAGPAFAQLLEEPRCGFPDYPYPEGVMGAALEANWPTACRGQLKFGRAFANVPNMTAEDTAKAWQAVANIWTAALADLEMDPLAHGISQGAHIFARLEALAGSTLAYSYLAQNSCKVQLPQAYNTSTKWELRLLTTVATHEVGHALGSSHVQDPDATMFPSIHARSLARWGYPNASDLRSMVSLGYKSSGKPRPSDADLFRPRNQPPTTPPPGPTPGPVPPSPGRWRTEGEISVIAPDGSRQVFVLVPKGL
jgi:hypothetical protein